MSAPSLPLDPLPSALRQRQAFWTRPDVLPQANGEHLWLETGWTSSPSHVASYMEYQRSLVPGLDAKGQAAFAVGDYSHMLASAVVPLFVGSRLVPDFSGATVRTGFDLRPLDLDGRLLQERVWRIGLGAGSVDTDDPARSAEPALRQVGDLTGMFRAQLETHLAPLVATLHRLSRLSRRALWRLVGDSFAQIFLDAGQHYGRLDRAKADAAAILKAPGSPLANTQWHYVDITVRDEHNPERILASTPFRARGGCCRYYTVEGGHLCTTCVLQDPVARDTALERQLRRKLTQDPAATQMPASSRET